ncbi:H-type small acid-soluble spore protein [Paenibacillus aurantiacus]|uniref:H-type small acid-soluble spore protein n=1 Tax=Paenibacillus aurantiacus TaxID=1936118 RepID=A0ABV5KTR1_9BACL
MNVQRAKEIESSPILANITFNGVPVYIQYVDEQAETARIYPLNDPEKEETVALLSLTEH